MTTDNKNVYAAEPMVTGGILVAPLGTTGPTSATSALNVAFVDLGYVGEDGVTETREISTDKKKSWGGDTIKILKTDYNHTFKLVLVESLNVDVLKAIYGDANVTVTAANGTHGKQVKIVKTSQMLPHLSWVIDSMDGAARRRNYIPDGQITEVGDIKFVHTDTVEYEITIEVFKDATGGYVYEYTDDGQTTSGS